VNVVAVVAASAAAAMILEIVRMSRSFLFRGYNERRQASFQTQCGNAGTFSAGDARPHQSRGSTAV